MIRKNSPVSTRERRHQATNASVADPFGPVIPVGVLEPSSEIRYHCCSMFGLMADSAGRVIQLAACFPIGGLHVACSAIIAKYSLAVRSYIKPFANWVWAGAILMAFGGMLSLSDRRLRMAAGARRQALPQPAE